MAIELTTTDNATLSAIRQALQSPFELRPNKVIVGGDLTGVNRGLSALDIQTYRDSVSSVAIGNRSVAIGSNNQARDAFTVTIGTDNTAPLGAYSQFIGHNNRSINSSRGRIYNTLIGFNNQAFGERCIALGINNGVGYGGDVGSPFEFWANNCITIGNSNSAPGLSAIAIGLGNRAGDGAGAAMLAIGVRNTVLSNNSTSVGIQNTSNNSEGCAVGYLNTNGFSTGSIAIGTRNSTAGDDGVSTTGSVAVGIRNTCSGYYAKCVAVGIRNTVSAYNGKASAFGYRVTTTVDNTQELGYWSGTTTRNGAVRVHGTGMVAMTIQDRSTKYGDGGATAGSEADDTLMRNGYAIRRNGDVILIDVNIGGTVKTATLATVT